MVLQRVPAPLFSRGGIPRSIKAKVRAGCKHQILIDSALKSHLAVDVWPDEVRGV